MNKQIDHLIQQNLISFEDKRELEKVANQFSIAITDEMIELIDPNDPNDPIAQQFIPSKKELTITANEKADPIGDHAFEPVKGITHRYPDRLLLKPLHTCPVYCRFCFRREDVGGDAKLMSPEELDAAMTYIAAHPEVWEVILTGGDPLLLSPRRLQDILDRLDKISHVKIVRIHSRVPIVDPKRITAELCDILKQSDKVIWLAIHANHPNEFTPNFKDAADLLSNSGIPLISQTVLLKGLNDKVEILDTLFRKFIEHKIKPYYLHHPDLAKGTSHFRLPIETGQALMRQLHTQISGICKPTYIYDIPGGYGKMPLTPSYYQEGKITDIHGDTHNIII